MQQALKRSVAVYVKEGVGTAVAPLHCAVHIRFPLTAAVLSSLDGCRRHSFGDDADEFDARFK
jgi:hypothetical protein